MTQRRCAIVTGAAQGLGRAIAERLLAVGISVVGVDVQADKINALPAKLGPAAARFRAVAAELSTEAGAAAPVEAALAAFGRLDILVNCAGGSGHTAVRYIDDLPPSLWDSVIGSNLDATYLCCRAAMPALRKAEHGRIVNFSSSLATGSTMWPSTVGARLAYCAAKGGIEAFSKQMALDLAPAGITVNVIVPGFILTESGARVRERFNMLAEDDRTRLLGGRAPEQIATPDDIAEAAAYLVSERASHVNGAFLHVGT
ncbi:MAG: SDR family NAD(P)-dependent oxidoreductase [Alphaproteobacteria bacterium]